MVLNLWYIHEKYLSKDRLNYRYFLQNRLQTKILVLRSNHHIQQDEFVRTNDLIDLSTHVIYDHKSAIYLPRTSSENEKA